MNMDANIVADLEVEQNGATLYSTVCRGTTSLNMKCASCGHAYRTGASFCEACGQAVVDAAVSPPSATSRPISMIRAVLTGHYRDDGQYPVVVVNVTNRCNLSCQHCFIFRDGNPNESPVSVHDELSSAAIIETIVGLRDRHGIVAALWMGGEPLLRKDLIREGVQLFSRNTIVTNGTIPLVDFGPTALYVVSLDGPEDLNDAIRGRGVYQKVMRNLSRIPAGFATDVQVQCVVTKRNQHRLEELVVAVRETRAGWTTFSFYVPRANDTSPDVWETNEERAYAVREVMRLKARYPSFVRNSARMLELMLPPQCTKVTTACPAHDQVLPLYLDGDHFTTPFCCYGNDVDCTRCGAWVVFHLAAQLSGGNRAAPDFVG